MANKKQKSVSSSPTKAKFEDLKLSNRKIASKKTAAVTLSDIVGDEVLPPAHAAVKKGKKTAIVAGGTPYQQEHTGSMEDLSSFMSGHGVNVHRDDFDTLDLFAQHIISLLNTDVYAPANLTKHERFILMRYFARTNPILGRCLDIHTELPLSKLRLQPPQNCPRIMRDYMMNFYDKLFKKLNVMEVFRDFVYHYRLFGESYAIVDDFFKCDDRVLQDLEQLAGTSFVYTDEDQKFIDATEEKYETDPELVKIEDRNKYLKKKFLGFFNAKYNGPDKLRVLKFYDITEYFANPEIDFEAIRHRISDGIQAVLTDCNNNYDSLKDLGYSDGYIQLLKDNRESRDIIIDNDIYSGLPFLMIFKKYESNSDVYRVIDACLEWDAAKKAVKAKIKTIGRLGRIVIAEDLGNDQLTALIAEVTKMIEDPTYAIVANYKIEWNEVNSFLKDELEQLIQATERCTKEIALGQGVPDSLISGESQYTGDNIKVEILDTQYFAFKVKFQDVLEDKFVKPIALRKGFVGLDEWGNLKLYYPKLTFSLLNLRSQEYFEMLMNLYNKGSLNVDVIYDLLNLDGDGIIHSLKQDLWTLKNDKFNAVIEDVLHGMADQMAQDTDVAKRVLEGLGLNLKSSIEIAQQQMRDEAAGAEGAGGSSGGGGGMDLGSAPGMGGLGEPGMPGEAGGDIGAPPEGEAPPEEAPPEGEAPAEPPAPGTPPEEVK